MKPASKKFWQLTSAFVAVATILSASSGPAKSKRVNELTLAGLRPGHDKIVSPEKIFRELERDTSVSDAYFWGDICTHRDLRVEMDATNVARAVVVSSRYMPDAMAKCAASVKDPRRLKLLGTGRGLLLGDACDRVVELYGKPESESPSVKGNEQLQLYFYSFDWAGPEVPQVMEVSCGEATGRVVEITLAASSL